MGLTFLLFLLFLMFSRSVVGILSGHCHRALARRL